MRANRREFLFGAATVAASATLPSVALAEHGVSIPLKAEPLPLSSVRLLPSVYATAVEKNRQYLLRLSADRLLHNFMLYAGLPPKGKIYGGWEDDTIAGHSLGHYMTALVEMYWQTGDDDCRKRADYIVVELARAQKARGNGYVGALGRKLKDGKIVDGITVFDEVKKGDIHSGGFDLNGSWSPLYTVHKVFAGLLDVNEGWGNQQALDVAIGLATYFADMFDALNEEQMQKLLSCEYGGLNESYAELYVRTKNERWLKISQRIYDHRVLDPLEAGQDKLANFHANTQIPKLIGLARIHEITGDPAPGNAAQFFWTAVTQHHSYVIGGNADREYFSEPDTVSQHITEQTCEHCNTYNMLKLTRHLYSWQPDGSWFDYYERAHLNHVMAAQDPSTGGFTYMTPLLTAAERGYSSTDDDAFWCCVGTGMESHSKHGESIYWQSGDTLLVNLYIASEASWQEREAKLRLETNYPFEPESRLTLTSLQKPGRFTIALRIPKWAEGQAKITVNGKAESFTPQKGYAALHRHWKQGDVIVISLPLQIRMESTVGDEKTVAFLRGPMVLSADLGSVEKKWDSDDPAMVGENLTQSFKPTDEKKGIYATNGIVRPADLTFVPFFSQYQRRSAVYFSRFSESEWKQQEVIFAAEQAKARDIAARSVDVMHLGEMQPERDHNLTSEQSYPDTYRGRQGREARSGGYFEFSMKTKPGQLVLQATYWGGERGGSFDILVDNVLLATQKLHEDRPGKFFDVEYVIPTELTQNKSSIRVRFLPHDRSTAGPVFGVRLFTAKPGETSSSATAQPKA
ncbi:MAG: glycoside hydrolase family 127 protein [Acidobacteriaceae bacterium]|nr:glycoside hydrolase family 127 protein [Acidobacteriaceae bacterium]